MFDIIYIAERYGISERLVALEKALLLINGVQEVEFEASGYMNAIYEMTVTVEYRIPSHEKYYEMHGKLKKEIIRVANEHDLIIKSEIEDKGEHFEILFATNKWDQNLEYALFYKYQGRDTPVGSEGWVPTRAIATKLLNYYENHGIFSDCIIYIRTRQAQKRYRSVQDYNGKPVYNMDHCYWKALSVGDYVNGEIYNYIINCITPACFRSDCTQLGEAAGNKLDENGVLRDTYHTLKKVSDDVYEYCGKCFIGENYERGTVPAYIF